MNRGSQLSVIDLTREIIRLDLLTELLTYGLIQEMGNSFQEIFITTCTASK